MATDLICLECGQAFVPKNKKAMRWSRSAGRAAGMYCTQTCQRRAQAKRMRETRIQRALEAAQVAVAVQTEEPQPGDEFCLECGMPLQPWKDGKSIGRKRLFCSTVCKNRYHRHGEASPERWDGKTAYSAPPPIRRDYWLTCMWCGAHQSMELTESDARLLSRVQCIRCRGSMTLDEDYGTRQPVAPLALQTWQGDTLSGPRTEGRNQFSPKAEHWWKAQ